MTIRSLHIGFTAVIALVLLCLFSNAAQASSSTMTLLVKVDNHGKIEGVISDTNMDPETKLLVAQKLSAFAFIPASINGHPVASVVTIEAHVKTAGGSIRQPPLEEVRFAKVH